MVGIPKLAVGRHLSPERASAGGSNPAKLLTERIPRRVTVFRVPEIDSRARTRFWRSLAFLIAATATVGVASTARTFSGTFDEPAHLAAGLQWLSTGRYTYDIPHPPLARVVAALGPYWAGARTVGAKGKWDEGAAILGSGAHYVETLALARYGELPFFLVLCLAVWLWGRRLLGETGAVLSVLFVATNPTILAHAGLVTNDLAATAWGTFALFCGVRWLEEPSLRRSIELGLTSGLAVSSKFSAIPFVLGPLAAAAAMQWFSRKRGISWRGTLVAGATSLFVLFAAYRFSLGPMVRGLDMFLVHGDRGHPTFLLGQPGSTGWWYYFPVALLVKTPLPLLFLGALGAFWAWREARAKRWEPAVPVVGALLILAISMNVRVNIGIRHILALYPLLALSAAAGALELWRMKERTTVSRFAAAALVFSSVWVVVSAHPDHLAYFNPLAGPRPEHVLVDSNLDWGQDLYRLRDTLAARGIRDTVRIAYFGMTDFPAVGLDRARELAPNEHATGWVAASKTFVAGEWFGPGYAWLQDYPPIAKIGRSMLLWYFPPVTTDLSPR